MTTTTCICMYSIRKCFPLDPLLFDICPLLTCDFWSFSGLLSAVTVLKNNHHHTLPPRFSQCMQSLPVGGVLQGSAIDRQHLSTLEDRAFLCGYTTCYYSVDLRDEI